MEMKLRQWLPVAVMVCGIFTNLTAAEMQEPDQMNRSSSDEMRFREITPNAGPRVTNGVDVFITADFIYWTGRQDGVAYARTGLDGFDAAVAVGNASSGTTLTPGSKWSPGFKAGIGLNLGHDGWDTYLNYTWFHTSHSNVSTSTETNSKGIVPLWEVATVGNVTSHDTFLVLDSFITVGRASGDWILHFNNFDLDLGRNFYVSQYLTFRPHAGLKGSWYNQHYKVNYSGFHNPDIADEVSSTQMDMKQSFWGVGIRTGMDASWYFDKNWSLFGDTSLSALWGRFHTTREDYVTVLPSLTTIKSINTAFNYHTVKPVLEFQLGLRYDYWFSDDEYHFGIEAAWEEQVWFNQNQYLELYQPYGSHGDLVFQGFTLDLRFDF